MPKGTQLPRANADIFGNARVPVLQLICYTSSTLKICLNLLLTTMPVYIAKDNHCDYSILNISMTFIYTIHPTSFIYEILLNVNEQMFHQIYRTEAIIMIDMIVSIINTVI